MEKFLLAAVIALLTVVWTALLKKQSREMAVLLSIAACLLLGVLLLELVSPVVDFLGKLRNLAGLDKTLMIPMLKTLGIGLITQICAAVCADGGETALGTLVEVCGGVLALYVALPLLEAVIDIVQTMTGG